jgi:hypothetical protein
VVKTRLILRPLRLGALGVRRARLLAKRSSVSVMVWSSPWVVVLVGLARADRRAGEEPTIGVLVFVSSGWY